MKLGLYPLLAASLLLCACASARLSSDEARKKIAEIGQSNLVPNSIEVQRIVSQSNTRAIAETRVTLAFQFTRANEHAPWQIESVRLGDRDWISLDELVAAVNEARRRTTADSMRQLAEGLEKYQVANNGSLPNARDIVALTDILHPTYMTQLVREDRWGRPIIYEVTGASTFRLVSTGADGQRGTADDVVLDSSRPASP